MKKQLLLIALMATSSGIQLNADVRPVRRGPVRVGRDWFPARSAVVDVPPTERAVVYESKPIYTSTQPEYVEEVVVDQPVVERPVAGPVAVGADVAEDAAVGAANVAGNVVGGLLGR